MGLNEGTNATYIGISDGKISLRVKESTPGAIQIVNKESRESQLDEVLPLHYRLPGGNRQ